MGHRGGKKKGVERLLDVCTWKWHTLSVVVTKGCGLMFHASLSRAPDSDSHLGYEDTQREGDSYVEVISRTYWWSRSPKLHDDCIPHYADALLTDMCLGPKQRLS